jgi:hypothetical protein
LIKTEPNRTVNTPNIYIYIKHFLRCLFLYKFLQNKSEKKTEEGPRQFNNFNLLVNGWSLGLWLQFSIYIVAHKSTLFFWPQYDNKAFMGRSLLDSLVLALENSLWKTKIM